jgi:CRP-like cAMP-binding protein
MSQKLADLLDGLSLFESFSYAEIVALSGYMSFTSLAKGAVIYHEGETASDLMVLISGRILVSKSGDSGPHLLAYEGPGRVIGEMALLDHEARSATCIADTDCDLAVLNQASLSRMVKEMPALAYHLMFSIAKLLSRRLRRTSGLLANFMAD